jgi:hypothetical protein
MGGPPPCGASLDPLRVEVEGEEVVVYVEASGRQEMGRHVSENLDTMKS